METSDIQGHTNLGMTEGCLILGFNQKSANNDPRAISSPQTICTNKVLLAHSHIHSPVHYGCSCAIAAELSSCNRDHVAHKTQGV